MVNVILVNKFIVLINVNVTECENNPFVTMVYSYSGKLFEIGVEKIGEYHGSKNSRFSVKSIYLIKPFLSATLIRPATFLTLSLERRLRR